MKTAVYMAFGASLARSIAGFTLLDASQVSGTPVFTVQNGHAVGIGLGGVTWTLSPGDVNYAGFSGQLGFSASAPAPIPEPIPDPQTVLMLAAGLALVVGVARSTGAQAGPRSGAGSRLVDHPRRSRVD